MYSQAQRVFRSGRLNPDRADLAETYAKSRVVLLRLRTPYLFTGSPRAMFKEFKEMRPLATPVSTV